MKKSVLIILFMLNVLTALSFPSWIGNQSYVQSSNSQDVTFTVWMNQGYLGLHCEVGISTDGGTNWSVSQMTHSHSDSGNSVWTLTVSLNSSENCLCYFHGYDDWGGNIYLNNGSANYSFKVNPCTKANGNWSNAASWCDNSVPNSGTANYIVVHNITLDQDVTVGTLLILADKTFTASDATARNLTIAPNGIITNHGNFSGATGNVSFAGSGEITGSAAITFNQLTINAGIVTLTTIPSINGTFRINGGNINAALIYNTGSVLKYNCNYNRYLEWNSVSGAGYPWHVVIESGTLKIRNGNDDLKKIAGNLTIQSGATFDLDGMTDGNGGNNHLTGVEIDGDIINNGTIVFSAANKQLSCHNFINSGTTSLSTAFAGDLTITGNFTDNGTFNANTRAIFFSGSSVQNVSGTQPFDISYIRIQKAGGSVNMMSNLNCDGINGQNALVIDGENSLLNLNGYVLTLGKNGISSTYNDGVINPGKIKGGGNSSIMVEGTGTLGTLYFDQSLPGTSNSLKNFSVERTSGGVITLGNDLIVLGLMDIKDGAINSVHDLSLTANSICRLSSTNAGATLAVKNLILTKSPSGGSEFYKNGRTLSVSDKIKVKVQFSQTAKWHFVGFPFQISSVSKSDGITAAVLGVDYSLGQYNATKRAQRQSGWESSTDLPMLAGKGYLINKKTTLEDLYFNTDATPEHDAFGNTALLPLNYTTSSGGLNCNFGWNFLSHPLLARANATLSPGEFHYGYEPTHDYYNVSLNYQTDDETTAGRTTFDAYFVKTASAGSLPFTLTSPQGMPQSIKNKENKIEINLKTIQNLYKSHIRIMDEATEQYDELYDAPYATPMLSTTAQIYTLIGSDKFAINSVPVNTVVPLGLRIPTAGNYSLTFKVQAEAYHVLLYDAHTAEFVNLNTSTEYSFEAKAEEINNRFSIYIDNDLSTVLNNSKNSIQPEIKLLKNKIYIDKLEIGSDIKLFDLSAKTIIEQCNTHTSTNLTAPVKGIYILEIKNEARLFRRKIHVN